MAKPIKQTKSPEVVNQEQEEEWEEINVNEVAYKLNPKDDVVFIPLEEPKLVKQNQASVFHAKILQWNTHPEFENKTVLIMVQKIPTNVLLTNIQSGKIVIGKTAVRLVNQGKLPGTRYYSYKIYIKQGD